MRTVYLTSGPSRRLRFGAQTVELRHAPRWQLTCAGRPSGEVIRALAWFGRFGWQELRLAGILIPGQIVGFALSFPMTRVLRGHSIRPFILGLSSLAAIVLLVRVLLL